MTAANDSDANKEASTNEEVRRGNIDFHRQVFCSKANATVEEPSVTDNVKTGEEPADASFETQLIVDEDKSANTDDDIEENGHSASKSDSEANDDADMDTHSPLEQSVILEGKRSRRPTARLELAERTPAKKEFTLPQVNGFCNRNSWVHQWSRFCETAILAEDTKEAFLKYSSNVYQSLPLAS
jgi:hypothetical protein